MKLSEELTNRGFINQTSAESLGEIFDQEKRVVYHGIDPTAPSAHAGNFVVWMLLKHLINNGHQVVFLVGGGTGMIGDPKPDSERALSDRAEVENRVNKIKQQAEKILGKDKITFVDNYEWLNNLNLISFLRDIGKHFTVNELIKKDAISKRLESEVGLSYTEFAYPLLQAYDYLRLYKDKGCTLQVGGSDQWGNIVSGVDLIRRVEKTTVYAATVPLIIDKSTGKKFGKSEGNAIWLDENLTSSYELYQFWFNVSDESVVDYLKLFTLLSLDEINEITNQHNNSPEKRYAQERLAKEVVSFVHGKEQAEVAEKVMAILFGKLELAGQTEEEIAVIKNSAPRCIFEGQSPIIEVMMAAGLAESKREARTFIEDGAVFINDTLIQETDFILNQEKFGSLLIIKRGKKKRALVEIK